VPSPGEVYPGNFRRRSAVKGPPALLVTGRSSRVPADPSVDERDLAVHRLRASTVSPGDEDPDANRPPELYILYYTNLTDMRSFAINSLVNSEKSNRKVILMDFKHVPMCYIRVHIYYVIQSFEFPFSFPGDRKHFN